MKALSKFFVFLLVFSFPLYAESNAEKINSAYILAGELKNAAAFDEASLEYKRFLFLQEYYGIASEKYLNENIEACKFLTSYYRGNNQLDKALVYNEMQINFCEQANKESDAIFENIELQAKKCIEEKTLPEKNISLMLYADKNIYDEKTNFYSLCRILECCLSLREWEKAQECFEKIKSECSAFFSEEELGELEKNVLALVNMKRKNPDVAKWLSLVPSVGQFYSGDVKDGFNALFLNGTLIGLSAYSLCTLHFDDFFLFEANLLLRFYRGNLYNAQRDAWAYNIAHEKVYIEKIKSLLERK